MLRKISSNSVRLGIIASDWRLCSKSVLRLAENTLKAVQGKFSPKIFSPDDFTHDSSRERAFRKFIQKVDIILELPRKCSLLSYSREVPILSFEFGSLSWPSRHLFEFWNKLWPKNSILFSCKSDLEIFNKLFPGCQAIAYLAHFPVDCNVFFPQDKEKVNLFKRKIHLTAHERLLLYAGRIFPQKNIHILLKIFREVANNLPNCKLCIVGRREGTFRREFDYTIQKLGYFKIVKKLINEFALKDKVIILPQISTKELISLYSSAEVFLNCTTWREENFGYAQVEAMACGVPVVCSAWGGLKDTVVDGQTGYLMDTALVDNYALLDWQRGVEKVLELLEDSKLRQELSQNSIRHVRENFSISSFSTRLETIIQDSLKRVKNAKDCLNSNLFRSSNPEFLDFYLRFLYLRTKKDGYCQESQVPDFVREQFLYFDRVFLKSYGSRQARDISGRQKTWAASFLGDAASISPPQDSFSSGRELQAMEALIGA